jgi:hypothetical protein
MPDAPELTAPTTSAPDDQPACAVHLKVG